MKFKIVFIIIGCFVLTQNAFATTPSNFLRACKLYVGADIQSRITPFKQNHGSNFNKNSTGQANYYVGSRFHKCFAIEAGYERGFSTRKNVTVGQDTVILGDGNFLKDLDLDTANFTAKHYISGGHIDLVGFCPLHPCFEVFANIGVSFLQLHAQEFKLISGTMEGMQLPINKNFAFQSKRKAILRLGLGAQYQILRCLKLRGQCLWENTKKLSSTAPDPSRIDTISMLTIKTRNSYIFGLGLLYEFF